MIGEIVFIVWFIVCMVIFFCLLGLCPKMKSWESPIAQIVKVLTIILFHISPFGFIIAFILVGLGI